MNLTWQQQAFQSFSEKQLGKVVFVVYLLVLLTTHDDVLIGVRICAGLLAVAGVVFRWQLNRPEYWLTLAWILSFNLIPNYDSAANHYWLTVYTTFYFMIDAYRETQGLQLSLNLPRALLLIVFGFASLQKIISSYFISGRLLGGYILGKHSFHNVLPLFWHQYENSTREYRRIFQEVANGMQPTEPSSFLSMPHENFALLCQLTSIFIFILELVIFLAIATDRFFLHKIMQILMLGFLWGTFMFRGEFSFFALLCILFLLAKPSVSPLWKFLLLLSTSIFLAFDIGGL